MTISYREIEDYLKRSLDSASASRIVDLLSRFYEPPEAWRWLFSHQRLLCGTPMQLFARGRSSDVIAMLERLSDSVYI